MSLKHLVILESKKTMKDFNSGVMLKEPRGLEEDPSEKIWNNMNFNEDKNCNGLKHIKYV